MPHGPPISPLPRAAYRRYDPFPQAFTSRSGDAFLKIESSLPSQGAGSELQELQKMIDSLQNPQDPTQVSQGPLPEGRFYSCSLTLQRGTSSGLVIYSERVTKLPELFTSQCKKRLQIELICDFSVCASRLSLPQPLNPQSLQAQQYYPPSAAEEFKDGHSLSQQESYSQANGKEEFEGLLISSQSILPPRGASEIKIKTQQVQHH
ncbi:Phosphatidylethanolamine-Binding Protein 1 [Manis pentadactyla]|nr:Phosphatidylethanolamine-Binding Protein 1 [Manis pentadactyla]